MSSELKKEPNSKKEDIVLDQQLRPNSWDEYVGQNSIKNNLHILLEAAKRRNHPPEHLLFYGPPGLGKTTLAHLISKHINTNMKITSGPAIEKVGDLASILTNLNPGDILFIDEIHRLNKAIEEVLYPAMESGVLDIIIGKGPSARTIQLELPPFTLVAATTKVAMVSAPLRSRFSGGVFRLEFYSDEEIQTILSRSSKLLGINSDKDGLIEISKRSRKTPRTANFLLKRCRDFCEINNVEMTKDNVSKTLAMIDIDDVGLSKSDRLILETIIHKFNGGPVGLHTLAMSLAEEPSTLEEFNEPYLIQLGFLERTFKGRKATEKAYEHLGETPPKHIQEKLL